VNQEDDSSKRGFALPFDNLDVRQETKNVTNASQNRDEHWVNHMVVFHRVSGNEYMNGSPTAELIDVPNKTFLPSTRDQCQQRYNYIILTSRILAHLTAFKCFQDVCVAHIPHKYTKEISTMSEKVQ